MKRTLVAATLLGGLLISWSGLALRAQSVKRDVKKVGHSTKQTAKDSAHKVKKTGKKVTNKSARKVKKGAKKVEKKTQD